VTEISRLIPMLYIILIGMISSLTNCTAAFGLWSLDR